MYSERDFWEAIARSSDDDDTACWMYADWLEEQGDARGEFVRGQCELERMAPWDLRLPELAKRCHELLRDNEAAWTEAFAAIDYTEIRFRRGVPTDVQWTAERFLQQSEELLELAPTIRRVKLTDAEPLEAELANSILWDRFAHVDLSRNELGDEGLALILRTDSPGQVERLTLDSNDLTTAGLARLISCEWLRSAAWELNFNRLLEDAGELLVRETMQRPLAIRSLALRGNRLGSVGFRALARARLPQLATLNVRDNGLDRFAAFQLGSVTSHLRSLETLDLRENGLQADGAHRLANATILGAVKNLHLRNNGIGSSGLESLSKSRYADQFEVLGLGGNFIGDSGIELALRSFPQLKFLDLSDNNFRDAGLQKVLELLDNTQLEAIDVSGHIFSSRMERVLEERADDRIRY